MPDVDAYLALREQSGLTPKSAGQAAGVAAGTWFGCYVTGPDGGPVAMGRIIGDGAWYFHIADMAVLPGHQRQGLGSVILSTLLARIREHAPPGAYVNLLGSAAGQPLYRKFGFTESPDLGLQLLLTPGDAPPEP
ncbi:GNAT family N-acetyltransferase [Actinoplanes sp. N902-109]|uniref:GNAT family N-acetyltransferase n=1 Tax=Actinoplanes sp. (strain N902-109) TaxID=649831 RepID=UPI0018DCFB20|nr:GNAT family N-acetyltransferase [Actinoplanes sp. N902-109]